MKQQKFSEITWKEKNSKSDLSITKNFILTKHLEIKISNEIFNPNKMYFSSETYL